MIDADAAVVGTFAGKHQLAIDLATTVNDGRTNHGATHAARSPTLPKTTTPAGSGTLSRRAVSPGVS